jgi:hypothetical protein
MYSSAGNTQLNFQFTKTEAIMHQSLNKSTKSELSRSAGQEQLPDVSEEDLNLSEDQTTLKDLTLN